MQRARSEQVVVQAASGATAAAQLIASGGEDDRTIRQADHDHGQISRLWSSKLAVESAHTRLAAVNCSTDMALMR
jgi:hypothetical protein